MATATEVSEFLYSNLSSNTHHALLGCFVDCLMPQQHASVPEGQICSDNCTRWNTEIEVADQTYYLTQPQYTGTGPTSPSADPYNTGRLAG